MFGVTVHVHPVALMAIVDSHERRSEGSKRSVGTLVGVKEKRGVVVIRNAYPVPHNRDGRAGTTYSDRPTLYLMQRQLVLQTDVALYSV